ncbi:Uncharacterized protein APZ42_013767 [Daphnia magna]|uniref:DDE-1 domain-containing protein n=1 Tax=Daphnia magna TaxID=35525 RepID=A0A162QIH8_9CRUS|nr:Uncharacterized protein APZ42_013767 [Daphnia magna]
MQKQAYIIRSSAANLSTSSLVTMPRTYQRKTANVPPDEKSLRAALDAVLKERTSIHVATDLNNLKKSSLFDYVKKFRGSESIPEQIKRTESSHQVLSKKMESDLLAFKYAVANNVSVPENWSKKEQASRDWLTAFLKRHQRLSISAGFFKSVASLLAKYNFLPHQVWNVDEMGISTVLKPPNVIGTKGLKQVQQTVSHERPVNTTMLVFICASGTQNPPIFVFPRVKFIPKMTSSGPPGCLGLAHPSGWVNGETFFKALQHFVKFAAPSKSNLHLLLLDNHSSHLDPAVISFAKENGIVMLSFPPHCSHRLQPLDVGVFRPFKISIHEIAELTRDPYLQKITPSNICSGIAKAGIHPFNRNIFTEQDFLPAFITDRQPGKFYFYFFSLLTHYFKLNKRAILKPQHLVLLPPLNPQHHLGRNFPL